MTEAANELNQGGHDTERGEPLVPFDFSSGDPDGLVGHVAMVGSLDNFDDFTRAFIRKLDKDSEVKEASVEEAREIMQLLYDIKTCINHTVLSQFFERLRFKLGHPNVTIPINALISPEDPRGFQNMYPGDPGYAYQYHEFGGGVSENGASESYHAPTRALDNIESKFWIEDRGSSYRHRVLYGTPEAFLNHIRHMTPIRFELDGDTYQRPVWVIGSYTIDSGDTIHIAATPNSYLPEEIQDCRKEYHPYGFLHHTVKYVHPNELFAQKKLRDVRHGFLPGGISDLTSAIEDLQTQRSFGLIQFRTTGDLMPMVPANDTLLSLKHPKENLFYLHPGVIAQSVRPEDCSQALDVQPTEIDDLIMKAFGIKDHMKALAAAYDLSPVATMLEGFSTRAKDQAHRYLAKEYGVSADFPEDFDPPLPLSEPEAAMIFLGKSA